MTFKVCNLGSKQSHLHSAYVVSVPSQLHTTVLTCPNKFFEPGDKKYGCKYLILDGCYAIDEHVSKSVRFR